MGKEDSNKKNIELEYSTKYNTLTSREEIVLQHYHQVLIENIARHENNTPSSSSSLSSTTTPESNEKYNDTDRDNEKDITSDLSGYYSFEILVRHYELSMIDFTRFYIGWTKKRQSKTDRLNPTFRERTHRLLYKIDGGKVLS